MITRKMIVAELNKRGFVAKPTEVLKNGITFEGIILGTGNICPTIYTEQFRDYDLEEAVEEIIISYNKAKEDMPVIDTKKLMDWDYVKTRLQLCIQRKGNENIVKRDFLDLEEYVRVDVGGGTFKVKPEHLDKFGVSEDVLFHAAWDCTAPKIQVEDMAQVMAEMMGVSVEEITEMQGGNPMIVATNKNKLFGAIAMKTLEKLVEVADRYGADLAILPSSIHEILLVPVRGDIDFRKFDAMVRDVNATQVSPEERLSDHVYVFSRETKEITF